MPGEFPQFASYSFVALIIFVLYLRLRRTFGRQVLSPVRMTIRMCLFAIVAALLLPSALRSAAFAGAAAAGVAVGVVLALWGASRTRFERAGEHLYYLPHTYTGVAVSLLFVGRVSYRLLQAYHITPDAGIAPAAPFGMPPGAMAPSAIAPSGSSSVLYGFVGSPLTLGVFFVLAGYYVCYFGLVLWKAKHLKADGVGENTSPLGA